MQMLRLCENRVAWLCCFATFLIAGTVKLPGHLKKKTNPNLFVCSTIKDIHNDNWSYDPCSHRPIDAGANAAALEERGTRKAA